MKSIVITGSTRGIGLGLAREFLKRGCRVMISGRSQTSVDKALAELQVEYGQRVTGQPCDVTSSDQLQALWDAAASRFGQVDIWINNAASNLPLKPVTEHSPEAIAATIDTNLLGVINGSRIVLNAMVKQGSGHLYNMEGAGSDGRITPGMTIYSTTKYALTYFTKSLMKEMKDSPVKVSLLSPGMVITEMWDDLYVDQPERWEHTKRILNILGDRVETVTTWLAERVLMNTQSGNTIAWLTRPKIIRRFLLAPLNRRNLFV